MSEVVLMNGWTKTPPTSPGWWWYRDLGSDKLHLHTPRVTEVFWQWPGRDGRPHGILMSPLAGYLPTEPGDSWEVPGEWFGPLEVPA
jgi:hypothetical protein